MSPTSGQIVVVGQGYVGLPVAMLAVARGMNVVGVDSDANRIDVLTSGRSPVEDVGDDEVLRGLKSGRYSAQQNYEGIRGFSVAVITVPTPLRDAGPDLSYLQSACESLAPNMVSGCTVVVESTTYPGTTEDLVAPLLQEHSGLKAGIDFSLGFSPERIDPGNTEWRLENTPKIVSGVDSSSLRKVREFYDALVDTTVPVPSPREAELAKLLENTFRHVNIALVNELLIISRELKIDLWATIDAAATKPFGFMRFVPGPGVGGHCLPIDPTYLSWEAKRRSGKSLQFVDLANDVNEQMPRYVVERAGLELNKFRKAINGSRILLLGLSYKKNSSDLRESPSLRVATRLRDLGAALSAVEPHADVAAWPGELRRAELNQEEVGAADLVILLTDHDAFDYEALEGTGTPVLDTRNRLKGQQGIRFLTTL